MNNALHNKVVKWFYDHEELLIAIMNKTPYQSDGWDYEIEVVKEFLAQPQQEPVAWRAPNWGHGNDEWVYRDFDDPVLIADGKPSPNNEALYTTPPPQPKEPEQEPVAVIGSGFQLLYCRNDWSNGLKVGDKLYTAQPQRLPLTDEEINDIAKNYALNNPTTPLHFARAIEAKLMEKNNG